jgi:hypothetical protein
MRPREPVGFHAATDHDGSPDRTEIVDRTARGGDADGHAKAGVEPDLRPELRVAANDAPVRDHRGSSRPRRSQGKEVT